MPNLVLPAWVRRLRRQIVRYSVPCELRTRSRFVNHIYGDSMNKLVCTLVTASVLVSGSAFGQGKTKPATDKQSKQPLRDSQMDGVTAGSVGGSIAANNSTVTTSDTGAVNLSGSALSGASAINIVNSTNSSVANGVNVYDSSRRPREPMAEPRRTRAMLSIRPQGRRQRSMATTAAPTLN